MSCSQKISGCSTSRMEQCSSYIKAKYQNKGYDVQAYRYDGVETCGRLIQIEKKPSWISVTVPSATLKLTMENDTLLGSKEKILTVDFKRSYCFSDKYIFLKIILLPIVWLWPAMFSSEGLSDVIYYDAIEFLVSPDSKQQD